MVLAAIFIDRLLLAQAHQTVTYMCVRPRPTHTLTHTHTHSAKHTALKASSKFASGCGPVCIKPRPQIID